jgi:hypothetical protein
MYHHAAIQSFHALQDALSNALVHDELFLQS